MNTLIYNGILVNEGKRFKGGILIEDDTIREVFIGIAYPSYLNTLPIHSLVDVRGAYILPGIIDEHVHFREPGLTRKADIEHESRAALAGGVTSVMDMPNVLPPTTTLERWKERMSIAVRTCRTNYAFYLGATNDNLEEICRIDTRHVPAVKVFMGSSTGNMLVDRRDALVRIFLRCPTLLVAHCEDTERITKRMAEAECLWGEDPEVKYHSWIRDSEACYQSSLLAAKLARETGARLHIAHISTERELDLLNMDNITGEACVAHLLFSKEDYLRLGTRIKCNPAIKDSKDRDALRQAVGDGRISSIATDHAPHLLDEKQGGCRRAASGMPMIQFSLVSMMNLVDEGVLTLEHLVELMCHHPANLFAVEKRGYIRPGYKADLVILESRPWTLNKDDILSKCQWSPLEGMNFRWKVVQTYLNGKLAFDHGTIHDDVRGESLCFNVK